MIDDTSKRIEERGKSIDICWKSFWKIIGQFLSKLKVYVLFELAIALYGIYIFKMSLMYKFACFL